MVLMARTLSKTLAVSAFSQGRSAGFLSFRKAGFTRLVLPIGLLATPSVVVPPQWEVTDVLNQDRAISTATVLSSGKVLVVGGSDGTSNSLATAELYRPESNQR